MAVKLRSISIVILAIFLVSCAPTPQQQLEIIQAEERSVTVSGHGEVGVAPDIAIWVIGIDSFDNDVILANDENNEIAAKVVDVLRHYNIPEGDIYTDFLNTYPETNQNTDSILRFVVNRKIKITIRDLSKLEDIKANVLIAGANRDYGVYFQITDLQEFKDQARTLAVDAAKAQAEKLAVQLDQEIGEPLSIIEAQHTQMPQIGFGSIALSSGNTNYWSFQNAVAFGFVTIESNVSVEFQLK